MVLAEGWGNNGLLNAARRLRWKLAKEPAEAGEGVFFEQADVDRLRERGLRVHVQPLNLTAMAKRLMRGRFESGVVRGALGFLEGVGANQMARHLTGDDDHRDRIHPRIGEACDGVGRAGAGGDENNTGLTGRAGIAFRRMRRPCLVAHEDMPNALISEQLVVNGKDRAAGIAEHIFDTLVDQAFHQQGGS